MLASPITPSPSAENVFEQALLGHQQAVAALAGQRAEILALGARLCAVLASGRTILLCGNGGSAADAQHIAAEMVGRFGHRRRGLAALALTTDTSALTSIGNDFGFEQVFARQVEALARPGDVLVGLSTSGNSANVRAAVAVARAVGVGTMGLLGGSGGALRQEVDQALVVPASETPRIQECHILVGHIWCALIDEAFREVES